MGGKPLLARRDGSNSTLLQISIQLSWLLPTVSTTVIIPVCRDYASAMGESATASGLMIGVVPMGALIGMVAGKGLISENDWNQRYARKIFLYLHGLWIFSMPAMALIIQASVEWGPRGKRLSFWGVLSLYFLTMTIGSMMMVPWRTMWNLFTPQTDKTFWSMMTQCSKTFGFVGGPIYFAFLSFLVDGGQASQVSPISMMSWALIGGCRVGLWTAVRLCVISISFLLKSAPPPKEMLFQFKALGTRTQVSSSRRSSYCSLPPSSPP